MCILLISFCTYENFFFLNFQKSKFCAMDFQIHANRPSVEFWKGFCTCSNLQFAIEGIPVVRLFFFWRLVSVFSKNEKVSPSFEVGFATASQKVQ